MRTNSIAVALSLCAVMVLATAAPAQRKKTTRAKTVVKKKVSFSGAENGLAGIKLFDSGSRVVAIYGTPDDIQAVTLGGGGAGPGGGAAGGAGGAGLPGGGGGSPRLPGGKGGGASAGSAQAFTFPGDFDFGGAIPENQRGGPSAVPPPPGANQGAAPPAGAPGGGGGPSNAGPGGGGMSGGSGERISYTRWVYNRSGSKFGFILDKYNHVIQCEAIGLQSGKAKTRRGITFGSTFGQIIKSYGAPDGYEFAGDNLVVRYLSKQKCAFRLSRLGQDKPSVVTGIVVAAGKR